MKTRITLTPELLKRLLDGKALEFNLPGYDLTMEIVVQEDIFAKFDRIFGKMWNSVLDKLDKLT
jgi:hypothetical protein